MPKPPLRPVVGVTLAVPSRADERAFLAAVRRSKKLHANWTTPPATPAAYRRFLARGKTKSRRVFFVRSDGALAGVVALGEIVLGNFRSAYLGFYAFSPFAGRGIMKEGLELALDYAFGVLRLHRVEANIQPGNGRSLALARRLGFRREGLSPKYLLIAGRYRDHVRTAVLAEEWLARRLSALRAGRNKRAQREARTEPRPDRKGARGRPARGGRRPRPRRARP